MITLLTDFGRQDPYVGIMEGILAGIYPTARLVHLTHQIAPGDIDAAAFWVDRASRYFPASAVHLVVVDPGVGTSRRAVAVEADGARFVAPDNGVLADVLERKSSDVRAVEIDPNRLKGAAPQPVGHTFHGRDLFAPAAALWARDGQLEALGEFIEVGSLVRSTGAVTDRDGAASIEFDAQDGTEEPFRATVRVVDRFGNLITDLEWPEGEPARVVVADRDLPWVLTYGMAAPGTLVALRGSFGTVEIAVSNGSATERTGLRPGATVQVIGS